MVTVDATCCRLQGLVRSGVGVQVGVDVDGVDVGILQQFLVVGVSFSMPKLANP